MHVSSSNKASRAVLALAVCKPRLSAVAERYGRWRVSECRAGPAVAAPSFRKWPQRGRRAALFVWLSSSASVGVYLTAPRLDGRPTRKHRSRTYRPAAVVPATLLRLLSERQPSICAVFKALVFFSRLLVGTAPSVSSGMFRFRDIGCISPVRCLLFLEAVELCLCPFASVTNIPYIIFIYFARCSSSVRPVWKHRRSPLPAAHLATAFPRRIPFVRLGTLP